MGVASCFRMASSSSLPELARPVEIGPSGGCLMARGGRRPHATRAERAWACARPLRRSPRGDARRAYSTWYSTPPAGIPRWSVTLVDTQENAGTCRSRGGRNQKDPHGWIRRNPVAARLWREWGIVQQLHGARKCHELLHDHPRKGSCPASCGGESPGCRERAGLQQLHMVRMA